MVGINLAFNPGLLLSFIIFIVVTLVAYTLAPLGKQKKVVMILIIFYAMGVLVYMGFLINNQYYQDKSLNDCVQYSKCTPEQQKGIDILHSR
jgi:hypothetical protein